MAAKPRVHEVASEYGVDSKFALLELRALGEFVKSPSSTIELPVARKLRARLQSQGYTPRGFTSLRGEGRFEAAHLLSQLPKSLPALIEFIANPSERPGTALRAALDERHLYYIALQNYRSIQVPTEGEGRVGLETLRSPAGLVLMQTAASRFEIVVWSATAGDIAFHSFTLEVHDSDTPRVSAAASKLRVLRVRAEDGDLIGAAAPFRSFAAVMGAIPLRRGAPARDVRGESNPTPQTPATSSSDVTLVYETRGSAHPPANESQHAGSRTATSRWTVSGHWRNQWYASRKDHERIWIEEHTAGAADGEVLEQHRVRVIVPEPGAV